MEKFSKLHLGCGLSAPPGWLNVDGSWNAKMAKYPRLRKFLASIGLVSKELAGVSWSKDIFIYDIRKKLPFASNSFEAVYSSHTLEHVFLEEAQRILKECHRVLKPGGVLRIMVPDFRKIIEEYNQAQDADRAVESMGFRGKFPVKGSLMYRLYKAGTDFNSHKWMYDTDSLKKHFEEAGFKEVKEMPELESRIEGIKEVEKNHGLCVEGIK